MTKRKRNRRIWARIELWLLTALVIAAVVMAGRAWLAEHPQHNPWAPLDLRDPRGWATAMKISELRDDISACQAVLERSGVSFTALPPAGEGPCRRDDRLTLPHAGLQPAHPEMSCPVAVGLKLWLDRDVAPLAEEMLGSAVVQVEQLGTYNCRRIGGGAEGQYSQHATANAIDISAFVLADGRRISVLNNWGGDEAPAQFLEAARDSACLNFGTVLSPEFDVAHADHFHLDQGRGPVRGICR